MSETKWLRNPEVLEAQRDASCVLFNPDSGFFCDIDAVGHAIWAALHEPLSTAELVTAMRARFDVDTVTCEADTLAFLNRIKAEGFVAEQG